MPLLYVIASLAILPLVLWGIYAQNKVRALFNKYSKKSIKKGITGSRFARAMLNSAGLSAVVIEEVSADLGDHYDPRQKIVRLSRSVSRNTSIAAIGIAAHEAAHAIQDGTGYPLVKLRNNLVPIVEKIGYILLPLLFFGIVVGGLIASAFFINISLLLFLGIVIFYLVTLPVEFDASSRAINYIKDKGIADEEELVGIKAVLKAAAFTYIIAATLAIAQFLRLLGVYRGDKVQLGDRYI